MTDQSNPQNQPNKSLEKSEQNIENLHSSQPRVIPLDISGFSGNGNSINFFELHVHASSTAGVDYQEIQKSLSNIIASTKTVENLSAQAASTNDEANNQNKTKSLFNQISSIPWGGIFKICFILICFVFIAFLIFQAVRWNVDPRPYINKGIDIIEKWAPQEK